MATITRTTTAQQAYAAEQAAIAALVAQLPAALAAHKAKQEQDPANWGFVGDLSALRATLEDALLAFAD